MASATDPTTEDGLLGGKLTLLQPLRGHRFGHDAVLLAAALAQVTQRVVSTGQLWTTWWNVLPSLSAPGAGTRACVNLYTRVLPSHYDATIAFLPVRSYRRNDFSGRHRTI